MTDHPRSPRRPQVIANIFLDTTALIQANPSVRSNLTIVSDDWNSTHPTIILVRNDPLVPPAFGCGWCGEVVYEGSYNLVYHKITLHTLEYATWEANWKPEWQDRWPEHISEMTLVHGCNFAIPATTDLIESVDEFLSDYEQFSRERDEQNLNAMLPNMPCSN